MRLRCATIAAIVSVWAGTAVAQGSPSGRTASGSAAWSIHGVVRDSVSQRPVAGAAIALSQGQTTLAQVSDDSTGRYDLRAPGLGTYTLSAKGLGYAEQVRTVTLDSTARRAQSDFMLSRVLPTVTITELNKARAQIAPSLGAVTYNTDESQIQSMGQGENASFQQVLLHDPGVVQDEFGEIHVRGDHGDVQYRINGIFLPESLNGFAQEVDTHVIENVTLLTGAMPAAFGDRTAGVIDITTKSGAELNGNEFQTYGGSYGTIHSTAVLGGTTRNLDYFVSASYLRDNVGIDPTTPSPNPLHDLTDQGKLYGYFSHVLDPTSRVTLLVSGSLAGFEIPDTRGLTPTYNMLTDAVPNSAIINENQNEENNYAVLSYQKTEGNFSGQIAAFTRYAYIHYTRDLAQNLMFDGTAGNIINDDLANGVQLQTSYTLGDHHTLRAGLLGTYDIEKLDNTSTVFPSASQFRPSGTGQNLPTTVAPQSSTTPETIVANSGANGLTSGIYLQDEWRLNDQLTVNYGVRYDRFDVTFDHEGQVSPRVNLIWQANDAITAHLGYAHYFMPPTLQYVPLSTVQQFEYTTDAPFNDRADPPKVERDNYFDAGIIWQVARPLQLTADAFLKAARNLLDDGQFGAAVILNNFNYGWGEVYGDELGATYKRGPLSLYGEFSYVQTWADNIDSFENEFPDNELAYLLSHHFQLDHQGRYTSSAGVAYTFLRDTQVHGDFVYENGLRAGFANDVKLPSYDWTNVGVQHVWHVHTLAVEQVRLRVDCLNVFNNVGEIRNGTGIGISAAAYVPPRGFYAGITAVF